MEQKYFSVVRFNETDLNKLCAVLMNAVAVPVHSDSTPYIMSTISDSLLTPLHDGVLDCMELLQKVKIFIKDNECTSIVTMSLFPISLRRLGSNVKQIQSEANATVNFQSTAEF